MCVCVCVCVLLCVCLCVQGAKKSGKAPDGKSYKDTAESEEMKSLF